MERENVALADLALNYQTKSNELAKRVREKGIDVPAHKFDLGLICPAHHKSIAKNTLLLKVQQAVQEL